MKPNSITSAGAAADNSTQPIVNSSADIAVNPMLAEVCQHNNDLMRLREKLRHQEFKIGDKVQVVAYVVFDEYKIFQGVVTRDKTNPRPLDGYTYSVKVEGLNRTEFDTIDMAAL